jgi:hypothetical protein
MAAAGLAVSKFGHQRMQHFYRDEVGNFIVRPRIYQFLIVMSDRTSVRLSVLINAAPTVVGLLCIVYCVSLLPHVYCFTMCVLLSSILQLLDCWLEVSIRKVLRPATSAQVFLSSPVSKSEC